MFLQKSIKTAFKKLYMKLKTLNISFKINSIDVCGGDVVVTT